MPAADPDLSGTWDFHVEFVEGPMQGQVETHQVEFLQTGTLMLLHPRHRGAGRWSMTEPGGISFDFHEVVLDDVGEPSVVVHVTAEGRLGANGSAFEGSSTGEVYDLEGGRVATNRTEMRARRVGVAPRLTKAHLDRPVRLRLIGDWGGANLTRVCGWLAHQVHDRSPRGTRCTIEAGDAGAENVRAVARGEVDVAVVTPSAVATTAVRGVGPFAGEAYPYLRAVGELPHPDRLLFAMRAELGVSSIAELRERRLPLRLSTSLDEPGGHFAGYAVERVLAAGDLTPDTLGEWGGEVIARGGPFECLADLEEGRADAVFHEAIMTPAWHGLAEKHALSYLSFDQGVLAAMEAELACPPVQVPSGYLAGLDQPVDTLDFSGYLVVVREEMAEELAFLLAWILAETADQFIEMNYAHIAAERSPIYYPVERAALARTPIPLHAGAAEYHAQAAP